MRIESVQNLIELMSPDDLKARRPSLDYRQKIVNRGEFPNEVLDIGKKILGHLFEAAKKKIKDSLHVSDLIKHDQLKYYETYDGNLYIVGFDLYNHSILKFTQRTNIPELCKHLESYNLKELQEVGAQK